MSKRCSKPNLLMIVVLGLSLLMAGIFFGRPVARSIRQYRDALLRTQPPAAILAQLDGEARIRYFQTDVFVAPESLPAQLRIGDTLKTEDNARARLNFAGGAALELEPLTQITLEKQVRGEALVVNVVRGSVKTLQADPSSGRLLIMEGGRLRDPSARLLGAARPSPPEAEDSAAKGESLRGEQGEGSSQSSLSTDYMVSVLQGQKAFFDRCYATHLQTDPHAKGSMMLSFAVAPSGQVIEARVLQSTIADEKLQRCIIAVLQRARFRAFQAKPIVANYPIIFE